MKEKVERITTYKDINILGKYCTVE